MCIRDSLYITIYKSLRLDSNGIDQFVFLGFGYSLIPVSYTHLDVYKRQVYW